jgi:hypothetical protein
VGATYSFDVLDMMPVNKLETLTSSDTPQNPITLFVDPRNVGSNDETHTPESSSWHGLRRGALEGGHS